MWGSHLLWVEPFFVFVLLFWCPLFKIITYYYYCHNKKCSLKVKVEEFYSCALLSVCGTALRRSYPASEYTVYIAVNPMLGVNLSPEFVNLYFAYAGQGLVFFFRWWQKRFEFQLACVAVEGRSNLVQNTHAYLKSYFQ